jgi:hypothetical protein
MAGLDPAIQSPTFKHLRLLPWMAASEGGHGVVDGATVPGTRLFTVMAAAAAIHDEPKSVLCGR